jgi:hypothetical protein
MMMYRGIGGYSGSLPCFIYVHIFRGDFPRVIGVCYIFLFDVLSDGGKVFVYIVLCSVQGTTSSCY